MNDIVHQEDNWRYIIYDTSKAPALGYVRWQVERYYYELEYWAIEQKSRGYMTLDAALREAPQMMELLQAAARAESWVENIRTMDLSDAESFEDYDNNS